MCGCITLLEAWIYAYFPKFRPVASSDWDRDTDTFSAQWRGATLPSTPYPNYMQMLDDLRADEVDWMPYDELDFYDLAIAPSIFHGLIAYLGINELYMPDLVARQFGHQQRVPSPVISPKVSLRGIDNT